MTSTSIRSHKFIWNFHHFIPFRCFVTVFFKGFTMTEGWRLRTRSAFFLSKGRGELPSFFTLTWQALFLVNYIPYYPGNKPDLFQIISKILAYFRGRLISNFLQKNLFIFEKHGYRVYRVLWMQYVYYLLLDPVFTIGLFSISAYSWCRLVSIYISKISAYFRGRLISGFGLFLG